MVLWHVNVAFEGFTANSSFMAETSERFEALAASGRISRVSGPELQDLAAAFEAAAVTADGAPASTATASKGRTRKE